MASEKTVNYTAEQTAEVVQLYKAGEAIENIAKKFGKTARSVIAKLSHEGVYKAKSASKAGKRETKAELRMKVEKAFGLEAGVLESLDKATHEALEVLAENVFETDEE